MRGYVDTSVLVKSYIHEPRSEEAIDLLDQLSIPIPLSPLLRLEFTNALQLKVFRKELPADEMQSFIDAFQTDIRTGVCLPTQLSEDSVHARALEMSQHGVSHWAHVLWMSFMSPLPANRD